MTKIVKKAKEYFWVLISATLNAVCLHVFINPIKLIPGGISGLASITSYLVPEIPMSLLYFVYNIPLLICAVIFLRGDFTIKTIVATLFSSLILQILPVELVFSDVNGKIISSIMAGLVSGIAMYLTYCHNGSNGGTEIVGRIVNKRHGEIDMSRVIFSLNLVILLVGGILLKDGMILIYSLAMAYCSSQFFDIFSKGLDHPLRFTIITENADSLAMHITKAFGRGVTIFDVYDANGEKTDKKEVVAIVQYRQSARLRRIIKNEGSTFVYVKEVINIFTRPVFHRHYRIGAEDYK